MAHVDVAWATGSRAVGYEFESSTTSRRAARIARTSARAAQQRIRAAQRRIGACSLLFFLFFSRGLALTFSYLLVACCISHRCHGRRAQPTAPSCSWGSRTQPTGSLSAGRPLPLEIKRENPPLFRAAPQGRFREWYEISAPCPPRPMSPRPVPPEPPCAPGRLPSAPAQPP